jgi:hypothetical protein
MTRMVPHLCLVVPSVVVFLLHFLCVLLQASSTQSFFTYILPFHILTMRFSTLTSAAALFELSIAGYVLQDDYMTDFYSNFDFFTGPDPTEGFVQFVDEATGRETGLINSTGVSWGVDTTNQTPDGRPSIRIESKKSYDSGLIVLDVAHMPFGCGTWPACVLWFPYILAFLTA